MWAVEGHLVELHVAAEGGLAEPEAVAEDRPDESPQRKVISASHASPPNEESPRKARPVAVGVGHCAAYEFEIDESGTEIEAEVSRNASTKGRWTADLWPVITEMLDSLRYAVQRLPRRGIRARQALGRPVRVVEYTVTVVPEIGQPRTESYRLITTLLDPTTGPSRADRARTCAERWESETGYADLKTYLRGRQQILRSKDPNGVAQELYALLIVYQLVQLARISQVRARRQTDATRAAP